MSPGTLMVIVAGLLLARAASAADVTFTPRELFRVPFGNDRGELGTRVDGDRLQLPRDFTIDRFGRFYMNDVGKHRIARYSPAGVFEMGVNYDPSVRQVFFHADGNGNLWLLIADPRAVYYGVHSPTGKALRAAVFSQYNRFRLQVADDGHVRAVLSHDRDPRAQHLYRFDDESFLMKRERAAPPPEDHHQVRARGDKTYYVDPVPDHTLSDGQRIYRITEPGRGKAAEIRGRVIYVTEQGDIYTRMSDRDIRVYAVDGTLRGTVRISGLSASAAAIRFDAQGNLYQLDGIPDLTPEEARRDASDSRTDLEDRRYTGAMPGMRVIQWKRFSDQDSISRDPGWR